MRLIENEHVPQCRPTTVRLRDGAVARNRGDCRLSSDGKPGAVHNCWRQEFAPRLKAVGLGWVNFQMMRRTHATLINEVNDDPKIVADQLGHTVEVSQSVYTRTALERRREAVNRLESAVMVK